MEALISKLIDLLPGSPAKWLSLLSSSLSCMLYVHYEWVLFLLPGTLTIQLSPYRLLASVSLLLIGSFLVLYFVVKEYYLQQERHKTETERINTKPKISIKGSQRFKSD